ncbi:hypothetical protein Pan258_22540 [Symmachiella dynata]|uniref:hypothetical protein n=1 Tax=Symmachiella dynata TaxID=2527995 RepID=UPI00118A1FE2|nr:hypothetical protein [Symmachiella dynata]QDT48213.1 hypothetical protein Pan258_22540 [Symmachiella dynata]
MLVKSCTKYAAIFTLVHFFAGLFLLAIVEPRLNMQVSFMGQFIFTFALTPSLPLFWDTSWGNGSTAHGHYFILLFNSLLWGCGAWIFGMYVTSRMAAKSSSDKETARAGSGVLSYARQLRVHQWLTIVYVTIVGLVNAMAIFLIMYDRQNLILIPIVILGDVLLLGVPAAAVYAFSQEGKSYVVMIIAELFVLVWMLGLIEEAPEFLQITSLVSIYPIVMLYAIGSASVIRDLLVGNNGMKAALSAGGALGMAILATCLSIGRNVG